MTQRHTSGSPVTWPAVEGSADVLVRQDGRHVGVPHGRPGVWSSALACSSTSHRAVSILPQTPLSCGERLQPTGSCHGGSLNTCFRTDSSAVLV